MQIFIDSADLAAVERAAATGLVDGVTTNPSLIAQSQGDFYSTLERVCELVPGPISAESVAEDAETMLAEGLKLAQVAANIVVKLPLTVDGLKVCRQLAARDIKTNVTLCFSPNQALLAAKAGATYISPFIGRIDDSGVDGLQLIESIREIYDNYGFETQLLAASIRSPLHVSECARLGADVVTIPPKVFWQLYEHPLTAKGIASFAADWQRSGQQIL